MRRCPKEPENPAWLAKERARLARPADRAHPQACPVLRIEEHPEVTSALHEAADYQRGLLRRPGGLLDQDVKWLSLQRLIESTVAAKRRQDRKDLEDRNKKGRDRARGRD